jgi:ribose transport system substrate-binding protein
MCSSPRLNAAALVAVLLSSLFGPASASEGRLAYLVSDLRIPFWDIMWRGVQGQAEAMGYEVAVYSAENSSKRELEAMIEVIRHDVDGIVLSPTNSSAAVTLLKLASDAGIPVVISDIGTESGEHVSFISSDNLEGSYQLGQLLVEALQERGWSDGKVGIIAIPQQRSNGRARTEGFLRALKESGVQGADIQQQVDFSYQETFDFTVEMLDGFPDLRAVWLQGSDRYQGALDAFAARDREGEVLLICFDAEPEFVDMIKEGQLVAAGMQQPFLMGERAVKSLVEHLDGKEVPREQKMPILAVSKKNIDALMPTIHRNVLGGQ